MGNLSSGCIAEFVGMLLFVFIGAGSIVLGHAALGGAAVSMLTVALAHAFVLAAMVGATAHVSGGQFNPAVSIGLVVAGKQSPKQAGAFIVAQLLGAACAAGLLQLIFTPAIANDASVRLGATIGKLTLTGNVAAVFALEMVCSGALMFTILGAAVDKKAGSLGPLMIGLVVGACILAIGPLTGASMNPARTFGPAICGKHWDMAWVYWAAPVAGTCLAGLIYRFALATRD